jgi:DNA-binding Xre family transcriptional regulator
MSRSYPMTRLEQMRLDKRLTPEQMGAECDVAGWTIRRLERGDHARVTTLAKLADYLGVKPSKVLEVVGRDGNGEEAA